MHRYKLSSYSGPLDPTTLFTDVFTWIAAMENHSSIPMEGIYRHAEALARRYNPAVMLMDGEALDAEDLERLETYLGKRIQVFTQVADLVKAGGQVWFSIALDAPSPRLPEMKDKITRVTVVHDTIARTGAFGGANIHTMHFGAAHNDIFLPVSRSTQKVFCDYCIRELYKVPHCIGYSGFHWYADTILNTKAEDGGYTLGVGTIYPRKNTFINSYVAAYALYNEYAHVGDMRDSANYSELVAYVKSGRMSYYGYLPDAYLDAMWYNAESYINLSSDEGFSLCPLEAIVWGVDRIVLSDIPAHREFYSMSPAVFLSMELIDEIKVAARGKNVVERLASTYFPTPSQSVIKQAQHDYFYQYAVIKVMSMMELNLEDVL